MNIRRGEVHEVVSFYSFLQVPLDAVRVCIGPVCDCLGAKDLLAREQERRNGVPVLGGRSASATATSRRCSLRGDVVEPEVTRRTNTGSSLGLEQADQTLADYEARGGLSALRNLPPREKIVEELKASGLTGYGGAGFPTGLKWEAVAKEPAPRYVVVNADEGEPGTIKDRYVMELRPHLMLEGTLIAMDFAEATEGLHLSARGIRDRPRPPRAGARRIPRRGVLDGRSLELVIGAGAYICGEETRCSSRWRAVAECRASKPPFPSQVGYLGRPTLINNVETLAHIPAILTGGGERGRASASGR
jgi:NADH:ubiquinone oxidoreductase subunit F (NADH-binding)